MTEILGASLGLQSGVSPSGVSAGVARRSEWSGLSMDVLLDDGQWCASAGDGEVRRRPEVPAHAGANTHAGELTPDRVSGAAFEALGENRNRQSGWIRDQQVHVVGLAVELDQLDIEFGADLTHGVLAQGEHRVVEHPTAVLGYEHHVDVQQRHAVPAAAVGRGCQCPPLRLRGG